jgi:hypothetical protein
MAQRVINVNSPVVYNPTDPRRTAYTKINENFTELYGLVPAVLVLGADVTNANGTANTIADVTGLGFSVLANKLYEFEFNIIYTAALSTTGSRWSINGPAFTYLNYQSEYTLTNTTSTRNAMLQAYDQPAAANASSGATGNNWALIKGVLQPSANGSVIARFASEVSASAIVAKAGSFVKWRRVT